MAGESGLSCARRRHSARSERKRNLALGGRKKKIARRDQSNGGEGSRGMK